MAEAAPIVRKIEPPPAESFDLSGLADLARESSPELAEQVNREIGEPPEIEEGAGSTGATGPEGGEGGEGEATGATGPTTNAEELEELNRQSQAALAASGTTAATSSVTGAVGPSGATARDDDLKIDERELVHMRPKTKVVIEGLKGKVSAERERVAALQKEKDDLTAKLLASENAAKTTVIPKPVEEELTSLRTRVRELDAEHDPEIKTKFDAPIEANNNGIIELLKEHGLGKDDKGVLNQQSLDNSVALLKKNGFSFGTIAPMIKKLSDAGQEAAAETLREFLRSNLQLNRERQNTIKDWTSNFDQRRQQQTQAAQANQQKLVSEIQAHTQSILKADMEAMTNDYPWLAKPAEPLPGDVPAVAKAKTDAIAAYNQASQTIAAEVQKLDASKAAPEKLAEAHGRLSASAVEGVMLRVHVLPRLTRDLAAAQARIKELETKAGNVKAAQTLSRAHSAAAAAPANTEKLPDDMMAAAAQVAKSMGIDPNS